MPRDLPSETREVNGTVIGNVYFFWLKSLLAGLIIITPALIISAVIIKG